MKNTMIFATWKEDEKEYCFLFNAWEQFNKAMFDPEIELVDLIPFAVKGKTYRERQASLYDTAVNFSNAFQEGLYWSDFAQITDWFYKQGKRYGLLQEFRENAIC